MSSAEFQLSLLVRVCRSEERLRECEFCCLRHRRRGRAMCLLYNIYHRADHPCYKFLHHFVRARVTGASAALSKFALVIPCCRNDQFGRSFLPTADVCGICCRRVCFVVAL